MNLKGVVFTVISACLYGVAPIFATGIYALNGTPITVVFLRSLFVLPILYFLMKKDKQTLKITRFELKNIILVAIFGSGLTTIMLFVSYQYIDVGTATTLHFLYPLCVTIICKLVYHDKIDQYKKYALILAVIGIAFFIDFKRSGSFLGLFLALASSITYAFYMVELEKKGLARMNAYKLSMYISFFIMLETLVYAFLVPSSFNLDIPFIAYVLTFCVAICTSFLAVVLLQKGIKLLGSSTASFFCFFEPVTSIILGYFFLQEDLTIFKILGCIIIFGALILLMKSNKLIVKKMEHHNETIQEKRT